MFSNGYSVTLNGENTQALLLLNESSAPTNEVAELEPIRLPGAHFAMGEGQVGTPVPTQSLPQVGPPKGLIIGLSVGGTAALVVLGILGAHHSANNTDFVLYDAGWQFQMVLDSPVMLDASKVAAAATTPSAN